MLAAVAAFVALKWRLVHGGLAGWGFALWNAAVGVSILAVVVLVVGYALSKGVREPWDAAGGADHDVGDRREA